MVSLLAGLQEVPEDLYEAATIDGANDLRKFISITIPQLMPIIISISMLDFIWTMRVFARPCRPKHIPLLSLALRCAIRSPARRIGPAHKFLLSANPGLEKNLCFRP
jgi:hypothetical protein